MAAERGRCGGCGEVRALTRGGLVRSHRHWKSGDEPVEIDGRVAYVRSAVCRGAGMPPIGSADPLLAEQIAELQRQLAEARTELDRIRHLCEAHRLDAVAQRARVDGARHIHEANRALLNALRSMMDFDDWAERDARFDRDMEALRAAHPVLGELGQR